MPRITANDFPRLPSGDLDDARQFFAALHDLGALWHPDDGATEDIVGPDGDRLFDDGAAAMAKAAMDVLRRIAIRWDDPDFLYDLAATGRFAVEDAYPGFRVDASVPCAMRTGYAPLPGRDLPTIVVEENGAFAAISFDTPTGWLFDATAWHVAPVEGARLGDAGIEVDGATVDEGRSMTLAGRFDPCAIETAIETVTSRSASPAR